MAAKEWTDDKTFRFRLWTKYGTNIDSLLKNLKWYGLQRLSSTNFAWSILEYLVSNDLLWAGLKGNYFWWAKTFQRNKQSFVQSKHCVNARIICTKFYSLVSNWTIALKLFELIEGIISTFCAHQALKNLLIHLNLRRWQLL